MSFVRVDRVVDVRVRFHRFPQLCGEIDRELVEVEERFLVRRGAFERRSVRGATKHSFLPSFRARVLFPLSNPAEGCSSSFVRRVEKRSKICSKICLRPGTKAIIKERELFFFCRKILPSFFFSSSSQKIRSSFWAREFAASTTPPPPTTHHARRSSRLRPRRVAFLAFRLARFSRARAPKRRVTAVTAVVYSKRF